MIAPIESVRVHVISAPLAEPFAFAQGWVQRRSAVLVEIRSRDGAAGWGECLCHGLQPPEVAAAIVELTEGFAGLVVTTGGTGFAPRDLTPEGTAAVLDRAAPGLAEAMRLVSPKGRLSRGTAGTRGGCIVLNLPGSERGSIECLDAVIDALPHALALLADEPTQH